MSYSRWSESRWYTFGTDEIDGGERIVGETFVIDCEQRLTVDEARSITLTDLRGRFADATDDELEELQGYIREWLHDVDDEKPECLIRHRDGHACILPRGHESRHNSGRVKWDTEPHEREMMKLSALSRRSLLWELEKTRRVLKEMSESHCCAGSSGCSGHDENLLRQVRYVLDGPGS